jgi:sulfotransferase family protein
MPKRGPIFIGGLDNSGKTALRLSLSAHPRIAMTRRSYMWTRIYGCYGDLGQESNFEDCLAAMLKLKDVRALKPEPERIRREFWQGEQTYGRLFALLHEHFAERLGKPRWGEQEAHIEEYADAIFAAYPSAKVIHMLRDPRNRYNEILLTNPPRFRPGRVGVNTKDWLKSAQLARHNQCQYPQDYRVFHYEDLVSRPEEILRQVCAFIEEDYTPSMVTLDGAIRFNSEQRSSGSSDWEDGIVEFSFEQTRAVSHREILFMQRHAQAEMKAWGYTPRQVDLSAMHKLLYFIFDRPCGMLRMATSQ